jgi:hypothetical protein
MTIIVEFKDGFIVAREQWEASNRQVEKAIGKLISASEEQARKVMTRPVSPPRPKI